jgi:hypothetical protein
MNLPKSALVEKTIPKVKFYEKLVINNKLKNDFVEKIDKIKWSYKLSEKTINVNKTENIKEIEIFTVYLKEKEIPKNLLKIIDKGIPHPILYVFKHNDDFAYGISLKKEKRVEDYYFSEWNEKIDFNFRGLDLEIIYENIIKKFILDSNIEDNFTKIVEREREISQLQNDIGVLENKIRKTTQFNRKVELNKELNNKKQYLEKIKTQKNG